MKKCFNLLAAVFPRKFLERLSTTSEFILMMLSKNLPKEVSLMLLDYRFSSSSYLSSGDSSFQKRSVSSSIPLLPILLYERLMRSIFPKFGMMKSVRSGVIWL